MSTRNPTFSVTDHRNIFNFNWVINKNDKLAIRKLYDVQNYLLNIQSLPTCEASIADSTHSEPLVGPSKEARKTTVEELRKLFGKCSTDITQEIKDWEEEIYERSVNNFHYGKLRRNNLADPLRSRYCLEILNKENKELSDFRATSKSKKQTSSGTGHFYRQDSVLPNSVEKCQVSDKSSQDKTDLSTIESSGKSSEEDSWDRLSREFSTKGTQTEFKENLVKEKPEDVLEPRDAANNFSICSTSSKVPSTPHVQESSPQSRKSSPIPIVKPPSIPEIKKESVDKPNFTFNPLQHIRAPVPIQSGNIPSLPPKQPSNTLKKWSTFGAQKLGIKPVAAITPTVSKKIDVATSVPGTSDTRDTANTNSNQRSSNERPVRIFDGKVHKYISLEELEEMRRNRKMFGITVMGNY